MQKNNNGLDFNMNESFDFEIVLAERDYKGNLTGRKGKIIKTNDVNKLSSEYWKTVNTKNYKKKDEQTTKI